MSPAPMTALVPASSEVNAERFEEVLSLLLYLITWHIEWCFHPQPFPWHFILLLQSIAMWPLPRQLSRSLACGTNLFLSSGLFSFLSSHLHSLCWPDNKGHVSIWGSSRTFPYCVAKVSPLGKGGFTMSSGSELRSLSGVDPTIRPYIVLANKAFSSTNPAKCMKVGSVPARVNDPALSADLDWRWAGRHLTTFTRLSEL